MVQTIDEYVEGAMPVFKEQLVRLVSIPSVSSEPAHKDDLKAVADAAATLVTAYGFKAEVVEDDRSIEDTKKHPPALLATLQVDPAAPWVCVYNHLDVQPVGEGWNTPAFKPTLTDLALFGRGATDDKGPFLTTVHAVNYLRDTNKLSVNVAFLSETAEEKGSTSFGYLLETVLANGKLPLPDSILVSDTIFEGDTPVISYSLRGLVFAEVRLRTAEAGIHSGLGGGFCKNPVTTLVGALNSCFDPHTGDVTIPGFYQGVSEPEGRELEELQRLAGVFDLEKLRRDLKAGDVTTYNPLEAVRRIQRQPTFEVHSISGAAGTQIPAEAVAYVSMRLVGKQDPTEIRERLERHLQTYDHGIKVVPQAMLPAVNIPLDTPYHERALAACEAGFGRKAVFNGCGGTIGSMVNFQAQLPGVPMVLLAQSLASDGYHAPNEHFTFAQATAGMKTMAAYLGGIGNLKK